MIRERHPEQADVLLLIEVADTSPRYDLSVELPLHARAGIPGVWIVDLPGEAIEVYREPGPAGYARSERVGRGGVVTPPAFADIALAVDEILVLSR